MHSSRRIALTGFMLSLAACTPRAPETVPVTGPLPLKYNGPQTTANITAGDLMTRLYIFADDSMLGRQTGYIGNVKGTDYIAGELKRIGIAPGGENGTYFQTVPLVLRGAVARLRLGEDSMRVAMDFGINDPRSRIREFEGAQLIYGGSLDGKAGALLPADQLAGKVVVISGYTGRPVSNVQNAAAVIYVQDRIFAQARRIGPPRTGARANDTTLVPAVFVVPDSVAIRFFGGPLATIAPGKTGAIVHGSLTYPQEPSPLRYPGRNVIGIIPGSDPALRAEYIAIGSHNDHVGIRARGALDHDSLRTFNIIADRVVFARTGNHPNSPGAGLTDAERTSIKVNLDSLRKIRPARLDSISNGADDDGSGSMGMLEIAEYFANATVKPRRSLIFVWHTGEEGGLYGSQYFTENPTVQRSAIVAQVNLDMIGRGRGSLGKSDRYVSVIGSSRLSTEYGQLIQTINSQPQNKLELDYTYDAEGHPERIYCRSDHWNYARYGIPIVFLTDGPIVDYHQVTDEPQYIDYAQFLRVTNFTRDVVSAVANLDHRVVVDKPIPDSRGRCVQ